MNANYSRWKKCATGNIPSHQLPHASAPWRIEEHILYGSVVLPSNLDPHTKHL